jgi:hypothetical protein
MRLVRNRAISRGCAGVSTTQFEPPSHKLRILFRKFLDFYELVLFHVGEVLTGVACRPPNFDVLNASRFAQTDVLLKR